MTEEKRKYNREYHQSLKGKESSKKYRQSDKGKKKRKEVKKRYLQSIKGKESKKRYWLTPNGIEVNKRISKKRNARRREYGFIPLNEWFEGCEGHHIDTQRVIYIPKELHHSVWHSVNLNINMDIINKLAFDYLINILKYD